MWKPPKNTIQCQNPPVEIPNFEWSPLPPRAHAQRFLRHAGALAACLPLQGHVYITTDQSLRFHHDNFDEMHCKVDSTATPRSFDKHPTPTQVIAVASSIWSCCTQTVIFSTAYPSCGGESVAALQLAQPHIRHLLLSLRTSSQVPPRTRLTTGPFSIPTPLVFLGTTFSNAVSKLKARRSLLPRFRENRRSNFELSKSFLENVAPHGIGCTKNYTTLVLLPSPFLFFFSSEQSFASTRNRDTCQKRLVHSNGSFFQNL